MPLLHVLDVDGAYFGTSFAHIFLMTYDELVPTVPSTNYVPRVFGFKVHSSSSSLPKKVVVLDLNSQSDANSSNNLASSGDNSEVRNSSSGHRTNKSSVSGPAVVFDLTAEAAQTAGQTVVGGNPRLSLQPPHHANNHHLKSPHQYQHPYQADQNHGAQYTDNYYPVPVPQYLSPQQGQSFAPQYAPPRQQEYPPEAYYDALARHHGNGGPPNGYPTPQPVPGGGAYNEYGQYVTYGYTAPPQQHQQGFVRSPRSDLEQQDPAKRPRTHF